MRVNYSGQRIEFTMPYRIDVAKWDAAKQRVKNGCTNKLKVSASEINAELTRSYTLIQDIFKEFELQVLMPTTAPCRACTQENHKKVIKSGDLDPKLSHAIV